MEYAKFYICGVGMVIDRDGVFFERDPATSSPAIAEFRIAGYGARLSLDPEDLLAKPWSGRGMSGEVYAGFGPVMFSAGREPITKT